MDQRLTAILVAIRHRGALESWKSVLLKMRAEHEPLWQGLVQRGLAFLAAVPYTKDKDKKDETTESEDSPLASCAVSALSPSHEPAVHIGTQRGRVGDGNLDLSERRSSPALMSGRRKGDGCID